MPKVFLLNDMTHDFSKAKRFGELRTVTTGRVPIFKTEIATKMLKEGLASFNPEEDYILISGSPLLCVLATTVLVKYNCPIKMVVFDAKLQDYTVRHINV